MLGSQRARFRLIGVAERDDANMRTSLELDGIDLRVANRVLREAGAIGWMVGDRHAWWTHTGLGLLIQAGEMVYRRMREEAPDAVQVRALARLIQRWRGWRRRPDERAS